MSQQAAVGSVTAVWLLQWLGYNSGEVATVVRLQQCSWVGGVKVMFMRVWARLGFWVGVIFLPCFLSIGPGLRVEIFSLFFLSCFISFLLSSI